MRSLQMEDAVVGKNNTPVAAIVLAAGQSRRMGARNKLHLPVDGVPLLRGTVQTLQASELGEIIVVLGYESQSTHSLLDGLLVRSVYNETYLSGQMTSVHCGLSALKKESSGVLIALGDQPALTVIEINFLIDAYHNRKNAEVVIPTFRGTRGNPIVMSPRCRSDIISGKRNLGCRKFIENNPDLVEMVEMPGSSVIIDLDTPLEYSDYCDSRQVKHRVNITQQVN